MSRIKHQLHVMTSPDLTGLLVLLETMGMAVSELGSMVGVLDQAIGELIEFRDDFAARAAAETSQQQEKSHDECF